MVKEMEECVCMDNKEWRSVLRLSRRNKDKIYGYNEMGELVVIGRVKKGVDIVKLWKMSKVKRV